MDTGYRYRFAAGLPRRAGPAEAWPCAIPVIKSSPGFRLPFNSSTNSVKVWSVIPVLILIGCNELSGSSFHTICVSYLGPAALTPAAAGAGLLPGRALTGAETACEAELVLSCACWLPPYGIPYC